MSNNYDHKNGREQAAIEYLQEPIEVICQAIGSFACDLPDSDYQKGYLEVLADLLVIRCRAIPTTTE